MNRQDQVSRIILNFISICICGLSVVCLIAVIVVLNPYVVGIMDSLMLQAPCCKEPGALTDKSADLGRMSFIMWKLATISLKWTQFGTCDEMDKSCQEKGSCCTLCRKYQKLRCQIRMDELYLNQFIWWNECKITNFTLHSKEDCHFHQKPQNFAYLSPHHLFNGAETGFNVLQSSPTNITSNDKNNRNIESPPAVQIKDLSINVHSIFEAVVDVNASGIVINVVTKKDIIQISSKIDIPLTIIRVGDWTIDELIAMIPPPPEEEGLYPRLGAVNLTDVKILSHTIQNDVATVNEIIVPDEFFYPLFQLTSLAGEGGTDRTFIATVIKKSIIMVLRKHAINEDGLISKTMEGFLSNMKKSSIFMQEITDLIQDKIYSWTGMIDDGVDKLSKTLWKFMSKVEDDWNEAMKDENNPFSKLSKEAKYVWKGIDQQLSKAGHTFSNYLDKLEDDLNLKDGWDLFKKGFIEVEGDLSLHAKQVEENIGQMWGEITKEAAEGIKIAKSHAKQVEKNIGQVWGEMTKEAAKEMKSHTKQVEENIGHAWGEMTKEAAEGLDKAKSDFFNFLDELKPKHIDKEL